MRLDRIVQAPVPGHLHARRVAGLRLAHRALLDEAGALFEIGLVEQCGNAAARQRDEVRVGGVAVAVRVREAAHFREHVHGVRAGDAVRGRQRLHVARLEHAEHLRHGDAARRRRRHAAHRVRAVVVADRLAQLGSIGRDVGRGEEARIRRVAFDFRLDVARDAARVKDLGAAGGQFAQGARQFGILQHVPDGPRLAVRRIEVRARRRVVAEVPVPGQEAVQARADGEALFRQADRRLEQRLPRQLAVLAVRERQHAQHARRARRPAAHDALGTRHRRAVRMLEQMLVRLRRRRLAAVERLHLLAVVIHQERAAADARRLRLDEREHQLRRDGRVDRRAALLQHLVARLDGQRIRGRHHVLARRPAGLLAVAAGGLGGPLQRRGVLGERGDGVLGGDQYTAQKEGKRLRDEQLLGHTISPGIPEGIVQEIAQALTSAACGWRHPGGSSRRSA